MTPTNDNLEAQFRVLPDLVILPNNLLFIHIWLLTIILLGFKLIWISGAYFQKFNIEDDTDGDEVDEEQMIAPNDNEDPPVGINNSEEDILYRVSQLGFQLIVTVKCLKAYAPWQFLKNLKSEEFPNLKRHKKAKEINNIKLTFECNGASYPHLPTFYQYHFSPNGFWFYPFYLYFVKVLILYFW